MNTQSIPPQTMPAFERLGAMRDRPIHLPDRGPGGERLRSLPEILFSRRATAHFSPDPVPEEYLTAMIELACQAPSGYNIQPWRFIVVREAENRERLQRAAFGQQKISEAPVVIIAAGLKNAWRPTLDVAVNEFVRRGVAPGSAANKIVEGAAEFLSSVQMDVWVTRQTMIAVTTLMYAAEAYGFDTAPMEGFDPVAVAAEFMAPADAEIVALLAIGRASEPRRSYPGRFGADQIAFRERYEASW